MPDLFSPLTLREVTFRNRIGVSPMCLYSCEAHDGLPTDWHLAHYGARAMGGAGMVMLESTAITPEGRITLEDLGIWDDHQVEPLARLARLLTENGAVPAIQIAHAGRRAGTTQPWRGDRPLTEAEGAWQPIAPSPLPFGEGYRTPEPMSSTQIDAARAAFVAAAQRADAAGYLLLEIHAAHGYLIHNFLSPLSNHRQDAYGGPFENRIRFMLEIARDVRAAWPAHKPLAVRLSCIDWAEGGWTLEESIALSTHLRDLGVDLIDCSSGGAVLYETIPTHFGFQLPFADAIRHEANIPTAAVGDITEPERAQTLIAAGQADLVLLGREMLRDPHWPLRAARTLGIDPRSLMPPQYSWAL